MAQLTTAWYADGGIVLRSQRPDSTGFTAGGGGGGVVVVVVGGGAVVVVVVGAIVVVVVGGGAVVVVVGAVVVVVGAVVVVVGAVVVVVAGLVVVVVFHLPRPLPLPVELVFGAASASVGVSPTIITAAMAATFAIRFMVIGSVRPPSALKKGQSGIGRSFMPSALVVCARFYRPRDRRP
jgi:hypothetical protein